MIAPLKTLGISSAFAEDADFSGMSNADAYISGIRQQTHFAIDEKGVDVSSFTQIIIFCAALSTREDDINLNRPFICGITATDGTLLFIGVCENPSVITVSRFMLWLLCSIIVWSLKMTYNSERKKNGKDGNYEKDFIVLLMFCSVSDGLFLWHFQVGHNQVGRNG